MRSRTTRPIAFQAPSLVRPFYSLRECGRARRPQWTGRRHAPPGYGVARRVLDPFLDLHLKGQAAGHRACEFGCLAAARPELLIGHGLGVLSFIIIDPAGMVPLVALRRTKKPGSARAGTCRDHAINGPRSRTTQSRGTPAIDAQRLNWLRRRRAIRSGDEAHPLAATRRLLRSVMVGA